jgi:hypothetical protein
MPEKPTSAAGYSPDQVARVKATCLYLATKLGDLISELVVVGGLVPSLLIDQEHLAEHVTPHVGTMDLDLGLAFALVGEARYQQVAERLRRAKFKPDKNEDGETTRQRWRISEPPVTVDFLIEPETSAEAQAGRLFDITKDWAAIIAPGLHLAFQNNKTVTLAGQTIAGETVSQGREIRVCGAGAFVVLKDAYDLFYLLRNYGRGVSDVAAELRPLLSDASALKAVEYLRSDFQHSNSVGPRRTAEFLYERRDAETEADAVGFVRQLLADCGL